MLYVVLQLVNHDKYNYMLSISQLEVNQKLYCYQLFFFPFLYLQKTMLRTEPFSKTALEY